MKKKLFYIALIVICLSILSGSTFAYFTMSGVVHGVITSGQINVAVVEQQLVDGELKPYPEETIPVMPGTTVSKIVSAQSTEHPAWIRMNYSLTVLDAAGEEMNVTPEELSKVIAVDAPGAGWTYADGWWYYEDAVGGSETTEPLFTKVIFSGPYMDNKYQNSTLLIDVAVQAVQQVHNGQTIADAQGWPEN